MKIKTNVNDVKIIKEKPEKVWQYKKDVVILRRNFDRKVYLITINNL